MADNLVRIGGAAIHDRAIAIRLQEGAGRVFGRPQRRQELLFVPTAEQDVIAPFGVGIRHTVFGKLRALLERGGGRRVAEPASMRTTDGDVERKVGEALVDEVVLGNRQRVSGEVEGFG